MKKFLLSLSILCLWNVPVFACEGPDCPKDPVLQDQRGMYETVKEFVQRADPASDWILSFRKSEVHQGYSAALWAYKNQGIRLATVRLGYIPEDSGVYGGLGGDLQGLWTRFASDSLKESLGGKVLGFTAKYARVGFNGGHTTAGENKRKIIGFSVGAAGRF